MKNFNLAVPLGTVSICYLALAVGFTSSAQAARIDFGDNPIDFQKPRDMTLVPAEVAVSKEPKRQKLKNGQQIIGLEYTVKRTGVGQIQIPWGFHREFNHGAMGDVLVRISGETKVKVPNGTVTLIMSGNIDADTDNGANFTKEIKASDPPDFQNVKWDESKIIKNLAKGDHRLSKVLFFQWEGGNVGDTVTVSSLYEVIATVPEPSSILSLLTLGTLGAASTLKRKLKPSKPTEKETTKVG